MTLDLQLSFLRKWSHKLRQKKLHDNLAMPPASVRVPSQRPLAPSIASVMSVDNDKGDNETILGTVHISPGFCLTAEEKPRKPQLGDRLMKRLWTSHRLKWDPFPPNEVDGIAQHVRKVERRGRIGKSILNLWIETNCGFVKITSRFDHDSGS